MGAFRHRVPIFDGEPHLEVSEKPKHWGYQYQCGWSEDKKQRRKIPVRPIMDTVLERNKRARNVHHTRRAEMEKSKHCLQHLEL